MFDARRKGNRVLMGTAGASWLVPLAGFATAATADQTGGQLAGVGFMLAGSVVGVQAIRKLAVPAGKRNAAYQRLEDAILACGLAAEIKDRVGNRITVMPQVFDIMLSDGQITAFRVIPAPSQSAENWTQANGVLANMLGVAFVEVKHKTDGTGRSADRRAASRGKPRNYVQVHCRDSVPVIHAPVTQEEPEPYKPERARDMVEYLGRIPMGWANPDAYDEQKADHWSAPILYRHWLIAGETGAGKGSVIWSLVVGLLPALISGHAEVWAFDPKRVELALGKGLFAQYAATPEDMLDLLRKAVSRMEARGDELAGRSRKFVPTPGDPLVVLVLDELAALTAYQTDRKMKTEAERLINLLLSQGRALGFAVVGALQDPRKDAIDARDLFPLRVGMRLTKGMTNLVLGPEAWESGARCDQLQLGDNAGHAYIAEEGRKVYRLVRAYWQGDDEIVAAAECLAASRRGEVITWYGAIADVIPEEVMPFRRLVLVDDEEDGGGGVAATNPA